VEFKKTNEIKSIEEINKKIEEIYKEIKQIRENNC